MSSEGFRVEPGETGARLDRLAAGRLEISRSAARRLIEDGLLLVSDRRESPSYRVREGEAISAEMAQPGLFPEEIPVPIVFEDGHLVVVDKPAGLVVHPGAGNPSGTLVNALLGKGIGGGDDADRPGVVHRLDRDTSGLMVVVKGEPAYSALVGMMSRREVERVYRAVVVGSGLPETGTVDSPVGRDPDNPTFMTAGVGKHAVTHFGRIGKTDAHAMLRVRLETGRTHQIRVHLSAIGHPVYADPLYGTPVPGRRLWLHAEKLSFRHPLTQERLAFEAPIPRDLADVAARLGLPQPA